MLKKLLATTTMMGLVGMIGMLLAVLMWGVQHDYVLYNINNVSQTLVSTGVITTAIGTEIEDVGNEHGGLASIFDEYWFGFYLMLYISTIALSYFVTTESEFGFLGLLFYGTLLMLFVVATVSVLTDWLSSELLYKMIPNLEGSFVKFDFVMDNIGMLSFFQMLLCIIANKMDLKLLRSSVSKEDSLQESEEIV